MILDLSPALHQSLRCSLHSDPHPQRRLLVPISLPAHQTASCSHSLAYLWSALPSSLKTSPALMDASSWALCHKMTLLSPFSEMRNRIAEIGRSMLLKASANLRYHKAWFFGVLISIALCVVTAQVPFDCFCSRESFALVSGRSEQQPIISAHHWGVWPDQRHTRKFLSEADWAGKALTASMLGLFVVNVTSSYQLWPNSFQLVAHPAGLQRAPGGSTKNKQRFSVNSGLLEGCLGCCKGTHASTRKNWVWKSKRWETPDLAQMLQRGAAQWRRASTVPDVQTANSGLRFQLERRYLASLYKKSTSFPCTWILPVCKRSSCLVQRGGNVFFTLSFGMAWVEVLSGGDTIPSSPPLLFIPAFSQQIHQLRLSCGYPQHLDAPTEKPELSFMFEESIKNKWIQNPQDGRATFALCFP